MNETSSPRPSLSLLPPATASAADALAVESDLAAGALSVTIVDRRPEVASAFEHLSSSDRDRICSEAWSIGLRSVLSAHRLASEARLKEISLELSESMEGLIARHHEQHQGAFRQALRDYFDPKDGRVSVKIDEFVRDDGALSRVMQQYLAPGGKLSKSLQDGLGELMRKLSPTDADGILPAIDAKVREIAERNGATLAQTLDPAIEGSAASRFFGNMREQLLQAHGDRDKQLDVITKALDAANPASPLSRLMAESQASATRLLQAINIHDPASPLAAIRQTLVDVVEREAKTQRETLARLEDQRQKDTAEVRNALAKLDTRRRMDARAPAGGAAFETLVGDTLGRLLRGAPIDLEPTGNRPGTRPHCKVGDLVLRFTADSLYAGSTVVVEAKRDASYTPTKARAEIETARSNRDATAGLFVFARTHAPPTMRPMERRGQDVFVIWDETDPSSDAYLEAGLTLALALAPQARRSQQHEGDIKALAAIESDIAKELNRYEDIRKCASNLQRDAEKILEHARKGLKGLNSLLKKTKTTLKALDVELIDPDAFDEPIGLDAGDTSAGDNVKGAA